MGYRVLVVGGAEAMRQHLRFILTCGGYEMVEVSDCRQALRSLADNGNGSFGLMIFDEDMPVREQRCLYRGAHGESASVIVPVLLLSREENLYREEAGIHRIPKPFSSAALLSVLRRIGAASVHRPQDTPPENAS